MNCGCDFGLSMKTTLTIVSLDYYMEIGESSACQEKGQIGSTRVIPSVQGIETLLVSSGESLIVFLH